MKMYRENVETLAISLPTFFVHFINDYMATYKNQSQSQVIQEALQLLRDREQKRGYRQSAQFFEKAPVYP
jgi:Arc/MetJ-type ribon-helix-helix transcriptional regulator